MKIEFSPVAGLPPLSLSRAGDTLTINGEAFDFSGLPAGATLPRVAIASDWIAGDVTRDAGGALTVPLIAPLDPEAPPGAGFPAPVSLTDDGPVTLPPHILTEEAPE